MNKGYFYIETNEYEKLTDKRYREKQTKLLNTVPGNRAKQLLIHFLENYHYIDEIQHWIIEEVAKYENKVSKLSDPAYAYVSLRRHLVTPDNELSLYRRTLLELLL